MELGSMLNSEEEGNDSSALFDNTYSHYTDLESIHEWCFNEPWGPVAGSSITNSYGSDVLGINVNGEPPVPVAQQTSASQTSPSQTPTGESTSTLSDDVTTPDTSEVFDVSSRSPPHKILSGEGKICYGMIHRVDVKLEGDMPKLKHQLTQSSAQSQSRVQRLEIKREPHCIRILFGNGASFGLLRSDMTTSLSSMLQREDLMFDAVAQSAEIFNIINRATDPSKTTVTIDINIYGPTEKSKEVGDELSSHRLWLQQPDYHLTEFPYENPHIIHFPDLEFSIQQEESNIATETANPPTDRDVQQLVSEIERSTRRAQGLERTTGDEGLQTELLDHQRRALSFMLQRESGEIPEEFRLWKRTMVEGRETYVHRITKTRSSIPPDEKGCGILADEMGMGKSLSILALVVRTLQQGHQWVQESAEYEISESQIEQSSHATLVVVPSELLITSWMREIETHLKNGVNVIKYHGQGRTRDLEALSQADIVLTTYSTLGTDASLNHNSPLHKISWYRIVLDEAHTIRRTATTYHRFCCDLVARSRWCLTGTPIQNRLDDIGALFVFLKAEPFHSLAQFRRFIVAPFEERSPVAAKRLILLYDSLILRRGKDILDLPGQIEQVCEVTLSERERIQYNSTKTIMARRIRERFGDEESKFNMFQVIMQLRIFCNHGTHQQILSWENSVEANKAYAKEAGLPETGVCAACGHPLPITGKYKRFAKDCEHRLCSDCWTDYEQADNNTGNSRSCGWCQRGNKSSRRKRRFADYNTEEDEDLEGNRSERPPKSVEDQYFKEDGYSSKMKALVRDVKIGLQEPTVDENGEEQPTKSIIFSCWTRTLDLIEIYLKKEGIDFLRIDGESAPSKRQRILDAFSESGGQGPRIMLMTTGTGAYGLNITVANRIFIVELQWNPSVERQAIARATRIGQNNQVKIIRYIVAETVEKEILSQQKRKREAAALGFKQSEDESMTG